MVTAVMVWQWWCGNGGENGGGVRFGGDEGSSFASR